jgi:hypothetical protein
VLMLKSVHKFSGVSVPDFAALSLSESCI